MARQRVADDVQQHLSRRALRRPKGSCPGNTACLVDSRLRRVFLDQSSASRRGPSDPQPRDAGAADGTPNPPSGRALNGRRLESDTNRTRYIRNSHTFFHSQFTYIYIKRTRLDQFYYHPRHREKSRWGVPLPTSRQCDKCWTKGSNEVCGAFERCFCRTHYVSTGSTFPSAEADNALNHVPSQVWRALER